MVASVGSVVGGLAVLAAACGGGPQPGPGPVTLRQESVGCREPYRWAAVNRADGRVVGEAIDLAAGAVEVEVEPGDSVSASLGPDGPIEIVLGVQPGDELAFGWRCNTQSVRGRTLVEWAEVPGATSYLACSTCACHDTVVPILSADLGLCGDDDVDHEDLVVVARAGSAPIAFSWRAAAPVPDGGTVAAGPWLSATPLEVVIAALPGPGPHRIRAMLHNGAHPVLGHDTVGELPLTITQAAPSAGLAVHVSASVGLEGIVLSVPPGTPSATLAVPDPMPTVTDLTYDLATRRVSFHVEGTVAYDHALVELRWVPSAIARTWVVVPAGVTSFVLPRHPDLPGADNDRSGLESAYVALVEREDLGSYEEVRRVPLWQLIGPTRAFSGVMRSVGYDL